MTIVTITLENDEQEGSQRTSASELDIHCKRVSRILIIFLNIIFFKYYFKT